MSTEIFQQNRTAIEIYSSERVNPNHIRDDVWEITSLGNYKLYVSDEDKSIGIHLLRDGYWEMWITKFFMDFIRKGDFILDIGAHVGYYTNLFADLVGPEGEVHAFEPNPDVYRLMSSGVKINGFDNINTYMIALSDVSSGKAVLSIPGDLVGCASITLDKNHEEFAGYDTIEKVVDLGSIDALFNPNQIDILKIDAEGAEEKIINGARNILDNTPGICIVMEWKAARFENPAGVIDYLYESGFKIFKILNSSSLLYTSREELLSGQDLDMLFIKR